MAASHVQDLFSAAYDSELSSEQWLQFKEHLAACTECEAAYETFRTGLDSVRLLPAARMPLPVHLPSGAPVAQRRPASAWLRGLRRMPLVPGGATAVAAVAAAAIALIALTHPSNTQSPTAGIGGAGRGAVGGAAPALSSSCPSRSQPGAAAAGTTYSYRETKTDPSRPGQELVLAASSATASAGAPLLVYASLSVPLPTAGAPGAGSATAASTAVVPCLTVAGLPGDVALSPVQLLAPSGTGAAPAAGAPPAQPAPQGLTNSQAAPPSGGLQTITIPAGTPSGTVLHIIATIPANYPSPGDPPLSIELTITVR